MSCEARSHLDSKIPCRHELQFELLSGRAVGSGIFPKPSGGLALEFAFADIADIAADHEAEQMLGIDTLGVSASRKQRRETHERRPEGLRTNWRSQGHWGESQNDSSADRQRTLSQGKDWRGIGTPDPGGQTGCLTWSATATAASTGGFPRGHALRFGQRRSAMMALEEP